MLFTQLFESDFNKKPQSEAIDDDYEECSACNGSGEGRHESESCSHCRGTGVEPGNSNDDDFDIPDDEYDSGDEESYYEKSLRSRGLGEQGVAKEDDKMDSRFGKTEWMPLLDAIKILKHYGATPEKYMGHDMFPYYDREGNRKYLDDITWNADNSKNVRLSLVNAAVRELKAQQQSVAEGDDGRDKYYYQRNDIWRVMDGDEVVYEYKPERYEVVGAKKLLARFDDKGYDVTHVISPMGTVTYLYGKPEMDEEQVNELSPALLQKASNIAKQRASSAENQWDNPAMKDVASHYDFLSQKFNKGAVNAKQKDAVKQIASPAAMRKMGMAEEARFPYPVRSEKLGRANMELLIRAYNEPTSPRTTLSFGNRIIELDRQDIESIANYYDNLLKDDTARWNFISGVMSDPDGLTDVLVKLGRRKAQSAQQPGLFQEADKKKEDDVKDVALQRAISNARASFPTAGSGFEALSKQFMQSQDDDQRNIGNIKKANRRQDQLLSKINQVDQNQTQEIDSLEKDNDSLAQRLQQLQSVNDRLEKTLSTMTGRKTKSEKSKSSEPSGSKSQKSIDLALPTSTASDTPAAPASKETPKSAEPARLALPEPKAPSSISSMTKQLTTQNPDVLEPVTNFAKSSAPRFDTTGAQDVVARDVANKVRQNISKMGDAMVGDKLQQVANDELGKQQDWTQQSANDNLPRFGIRQAAENKESNPEAPEADYDDPKWDAMVKRVGQKAKEGPRKTVWDPVKRVYKTVPVNPVKEQEPGNRAGYNAIKSVSDWAEKMRTMRELQKDVSLMTDPSAKAAVQQRISELLNFGIQQGYIK